MKSFGLPLVCGMPAMTRLRAGGWLTGNQEPLSVPFLLSLTAATTRPTLVLTCSASTLDDCTRPVSDWVTMLCGGTVMPLSALSSSGPPLVRSVVAVTCALAGALSVLMR